MCLVKLHCGIVWFYCLGLFFTCYLVGGHPSVISVSTKLKRRVRPRFFDQVGHDTMYASSGNKHYFTKWCHRQTYQKYEQPPPTSQNSYFQSHFSVLKIGWIFLKKISMKNIWLGDQLLLKNVLEYFEF